MTRKTFFALLVSPLAIIAATPPDQASLDAGNEFARLYNIWAAYRRQMGTVDAGEIRAWKAARQAWKKLDRTIRYE